MGIDDMDWRPSATLASLRQAALLRGSIRSWMEHQLVLEVCTPGLSRAAATDPHIESLVVSDSPSSRRPWYLHTSPEFAMKRLLAAHAEQTGLAGGESTQPDIYQICSVYRSGESGRFHNTQFTLLEWYRVGMDHADLMRDLEDLLKHLCSAFDLTWPGIEKRSYGIEVKELLGVWPELASIEIIQSYFKKMNRSYPSGIGEDMDAALDLFMDEFVLPEFSPSSFTLLTDYPESQAALSRIGSDDQGRRIAQRFELYRGQIELGNGFHELTDAKEQRSRFERELAKRLDDRMDQVPIDNQLLDALAAGLPDCAGIAVGLERLHMVLGSHEHIRDVLSFDDERA